MPGSNPFAVIITRSKRCFSYSPNHSEVCLESQILSFIYIYVVCVCVCMCMYEMDLYVCSFYALMWKRQN